MMIAKLIPSNQIKKKNKCPKWTWKKPKDKPKRPLSAYNIFFAHVRQNLITERYLTQSNAADTRANRPLGFGSMARTVAAQWKVIDANQKVFFEHEASLERERYNIELARWKEVQACKTRGEEPPQSLVVGEADRLIVSPSPSSCGLLEVRDEQQCCARWDASASVYPWNRVDNSNSNNSAHVVHAASPTTEQQQQQQPNHQFYLLDECDEYSCASLEFLRYFFPWPEQGDAQSLSGGDCSTAGLASDLTTHSDRSISRRILEATFSAALRVDDSDYAEHFRRSSIPREIFVPSKYLASSPAEHSQSPTASCCADLSPQFHDQSSVDHLVSMLGHEDCKLLIHMILD
jgi:hypothetical protein